MLKLYSGGCHCGAVRFEAQIDISAGTGKCNCTLCTKMRLWSVKVAAARFLCISGEAALTDIAVATLLPTTHFASTAACGRLSGWRCPTCPVQFTTTSTSPALRAST